MLEILKSDDPSEEDDIVGQSPGINSSEQQLYGGASSHGLARIKDYGKNKRNKRMRSVNVHFSEDSFLKVPDKDSRFESKLIDQEITSHMTSQNAKPLGQKTLVPSILRSPGSMKQTKIILAADRQRSPRRTKTQ